MHVPVGRVSFGAEKLCRKFQKSYGKHYPIETLCVQRCLFKRGLDFHDHGAGTETGYPRNRNIVK